MRKQADDKEKEEELIKRNAGLRDNINSRLPLELNVNNEVYACKYFPFKECYAPFFEDRKSANYILLNKFRDIPRCIIYKELQNELKNNDNEIK